jgi:AraC-like DNA-binding protein
VDLNKIRKDCELYYRAIGIPLIYYSADIGSVYSVPNHLHRSFFVEWASLFSEKNPSVYISPSQGFYGIIRIDSDNYVVVGPAYNIPINENIINSFLRENLINQDNREHAGTILYNTPKVSLSVFVEKLALLYYLLTDHVINTKTHFADVYFTENETDVIKKRQSKSIESSIQIKESNGFHNTYLWEQQFYRIIQKGNINKMNEFLQSSSVMHLTPGTMADTPLRQAKNLFIGSITKIAVLGAIPGGLDIELAYQLIDSYVQECEKAISLTDIDKLNYSCVMDFCRRVAACNIPANISSEVLKCISYIRDHTNENIRIDDVISLTNRSSAYILRKFKNEVGISMGAFISKCKLEDAKELLVFTQMSLSEISSYLCYSSQSYFQNLFKKEYGVTPMNYRKEHDY